MRILKLIVVLFIVVVCHNNARATNYYISNTGSDSATGLTPATAWRTTGMKYTVTLRAGDSLLYRGGDTFSGMIYLSPSESGTATSPIVISSYGTGRATITAGTREGIYGYNNGGITIANLNVRGDGDTVNTSSGVFFYVDRIGGVTMNSIVIDSVDVSGFKKSGVEFLAYPADSSRSGFRNIRITHVVSHNNGNSGISTTGLFLITDTLYSFHNLYIAYCNAYNNRGSSALPTGNGIVIGQVDSAIITHCMAYNNGVTGRGGAGIWAWDANHVIIEHCEAHHNRTLGSDGDGFDLDGGVSNSIMQYNYSHDNDGAGFLVWQFDYARPKRNNVIRYNVSENDSRQHNGYYGVVAIGGGDSTVSSGVHDVLVYNNTFYKTRIAGPDSNQGPAISVAGDRITGIKVYNNIFVFDSTSRFLYDYDHADISMINNCYCSNYGFQATHGTTHYTTIASWAAATGNETIGTTLMAHTSDPQLLNRGVAGTIGNTDSLFRLRNYYGLAPTSPCIDSGLNLYISYTISMGMRDFSGVSTPMGAGYELGAFEYLLPLQTLSVGLGNAFSILPNPFHNSFSVATKGPSAPVTVYMYNTLGQLVYTNLQYAFTTIEVKDLPPGFYTLLLNDGSHVQRLKLLKE